MGYLAGWDDSQKENNDNEPEVDMVPFVFKEVFVSQSNKSQHYIKHEYTLKNIIHDE